MKISAVFGTRPEVVKLAPVFWALDGHVQTIHTGQHTSDAMARDLWTLLEIGEPDIVLELDGSERGAKIGEAVARVGEVFDAARPDVVVVQGDTDSTLAGALAASVRSIPIVHVEAGLRSYDRAMPEERNRVVVDHLADLCCAPTETSAAQLRSEGVDARQIIVTGNTVVDAALRMMPGPKRTAEIVRSFGLAHDQFVLSTLHRAENVDDPVHLRAIIDELRTLSMPVLLPVHPRTATRARDFGIMLDEGAVRCVEPLAYDVFLALESACALLITDSGGVQEEASIVKRPVLVVRTSTERPEIMGTFATLTPPGARLGTIVAEWARDIGERRVALERQPCPFGDGAAGQRVAEVIHSLAGAAGT
jgi:UDP-N-acetylglucosamine 2-epimerase (non-hydrolysing)